MWLNGALESTDAPRAASFSYGLGIRRASESCLYLRLPIPTYLFTSALFILRPSRPRRATTWLLCNYILLILYLYLAIAFIQYCRSTDVTLQHCILDQFALTPVPGQRQVTPNSSQNGDRKRVLQAQVLPQSHASRLFSHRRNFDTCSLDHTTTRRIKLAIALPARFSSPTYCRRRSLIVASNLSRRHSHQLLPSHTRHRTRAASKDVHFHLFQPRHRPCRQLPHSSIALKYWPKALQGRAAKV